MRADEIRAEVCKEYASDNVTPDEVILEENGDIVIDRRKTISWAKPTVVGRWK